MRSSNEDDVTIIGAGITLHEAMKAADELESDGISARVIDLYSIKPVDVETLAVAAVETGHIVTVEDHWPEGGLGEAVLTALAGAGVKPRVEMLAVRGMPTSGEASELMAAAGIDAAHVAAAVRRLLADDIPSS